MEKKKRVKTDKENLLDAALVLWYHQMRDKGDLISGQMVQEKGRQINEMMQGTSTFKGSDRWLTSFRKRNNIKKIILKNEKIYYYNKPINEFTTNFKKMISMNNFAAENIYNADEAGISWRMLLAQTKYINPQDRVTALFCSNAAGTHQIPLLIVGKRKHVNCLENLTDEMRWKRLKFIKNYNVVYTDQIKAWMDREIFMLWYKEVFIPCVLKHQKKTGKTGRVLLILDNAPCHPKGSDLNSVHENFEVVFLPMNVPALFQPMSHGLILSTKRIYKKYLLRRLLNNYKFLGNSGALKNMDLQECLILLGLAWNLLKQPILQEVWKPLLGENLAEDKDPLSMEMDIEIPQSSTSTSTVGQSSTSTSTVHQSSTSTSTVDQSSTSTSIVDQSSRESNLHCFENYVENSAKLPNDVCYQLSTILAGPYCSWEKSRHILMEWFDNDHNDCGWEPMTDDEIIYFIKNGKYDDDNLIILDDDDDEDDGVIFDPQGIPTVEAFQGLMKFKKWIESCGLTSPTNVRSVRALEKLILPEINQLAQLHETGDKDFFEILGV